MEMGGKMELGKHYRIDEIVAHAAPMQLLDELIAYDVESIVVGVTVRSDSEFCMPGVGVPAWVGMEYMAQTVGAFSGIEEVQAGLRPQIGLLLGSRRYRSTVDVFPIGARLQVTACMQLRDENNLVCFDCEIQMNGAPVATGDLKAVRPKNVLELVSAGSDVTQR